jgi:DNA-directed RNA polymerase specialized sigma54-like protein
LDVCLPDEIVDRIKQEESLQAIDNARGALLEFYRSDYPINASQEERKKLLQENDKVKSLIDALNEYLKQDDISKSKRFLINAMIKNLDGTYF